MSVSSQAAPADGATPPSTVAMRDLIHFLAATHGVAPDPAVLDDAERRLRRQPPGDPVEGLRLLAADAGLSMARVTRPLGDVLRDASSAMPWVALRRRDGRTEALAVLGTAAGGARVVVPGADARPCRWSPTALCDWLQTPDAGAPAEWLIAEPAAPLSALRSTAAGRVAPSVRLRALLGTERGTLWIAVVYSAVIGLLSLVVPIAVQLLVNTIAFGSLLQPLAVLMVAVLVALGCSTALNALRAGVVEIVQRSIFARVATDVTWRLLRVRVDAFDRYHGPELVNRFFDTVTVQKAAALLLIDGLSVTMQTAIGLVLLALYHPILLAFDVLLVLAMAFIIGPLGRGAVGTAIKESKAKYALEAWLEQIAAHLITFKSSGAMPFATARAHRLLEDYLQYRRAHFRILIRQVVGAFGLQAVASATLLGIGGWLVVNRQLTLGQLVASELVVTLMMSAFTKFGKQLEVYYDLCAALDKLGDLVDLPLERGGGESVLPGTGPIGVTLRDLEVRYPDAGRAALEVRAFTVQPGEHLGLTGPIGSGKSTLADVLFGLRTPSAGAVLFDGVDMRHVPLGTIREAVALVRGIELFPGSVVDNVRLGRSHLTLDEISRVLAAVGLLDELRHLPDGLDTVLHPHGRPLSHRQAGRLMIARALAGRPRLLVLDGALDVVDQPDEQPRLDAVLFAPDAPWTTLCISDRPEVLGRCSRVVRLRDGAVVEEDR